DAPAQAAAEGADDFVAAVGEVEARERFVDAIGELAAAHAVEVAVVAEVFFGGELLVEAGRLEDDGDLRTNGVGVAGEVEIEDANGARLWGNECGEDPKEGGFAGAVG